MDSRTVVLVALPIFLICLTVLPSVEAQTTSITNLQYPAQVVLQNGVAQATVTFTVTFAGLPSGDYLVMGVLDANTVKYVKGSGMATPDECTPTVGTGYANAAVCVASPSSGSGTESVTLTLALDSTQQYSLLVASGMATSSSNSQSVPGSVSQQSFSISVTSQTISTTSTPEFQWTSLTFLTIVLMLVVALRRRSESREPKSG